MYQQGFLELESCRLTSTRLCSRAAVWQDFRVDAFAQQSF